VHLIGFYSKNIRKVCAFVTFFSASVMQNDGPLQQHFASVSLHFSTSTCRLPVYEV